MKPKPSSKADILCSGWWKRLWRLAVNGRRPTEPTHSGGQIGLLVANAQQGLQTWCSGATPFSKSTMTPYMDTSRLVAEDLFSKISYYLSNQISPQGVFKGARLSSFGEQTVERSHRAVWGDIFWIPRTLNVEEVNRPRRRLQPVKSHADKPPATRVGCHHIILLSHQQIIINIITSHV